MTTLQLKKLKMYLAIRVLLRANPDIVAKMPNAEEYLTVLDAVILDIQTYIVRQQEGNKEIKNQREKLKVQLVTNFIETGRQLQAYASYKKDNILLNSLKLAKSYLNRQEDIDLVAYGKRIYKQGNEHLTDLKPYGVTADTQTVLLEDITQFENLIPLISNSKQGLKSLNNTINYSYKKGDEIIARLDKQVELVRTSEPKFYTDYKALRKIDMPTDVMQLIARITDAETDAGLPNATVTFTMHDSTTSPIVKTTAKKGGFQIKSIPNGIYTVTIVKLGYLTQIHTITLPGDKPYSLDVKLVKG
jgi:hypothetical protein